MDSEFPAYVTVVRNRGSFYAAVMTWNKYGEMYELDRTRKHQFRRTRTEAIIDAESMARRLEMEMRDGD